MVVEIMIIYASKLSYLLLRNTALNDVSDIHRTSVQWSMANSLFLATVIRIGLVVISYGCKVPAGIFVPSMAIGATFGRMVGIIVKAMYRYVSTPSHILLYC